MQVIVDRALAPFGRRETAIAGFGSDLEVFLAALLLGQHRLPERHLLIGVLLLQRGQRLRVGGRRHGSGRISGLADEIHELLRHVLASLHELHGRSP